MEAQMDSGEEGQPIELSIMEKDATPVGNTIYTAPTVVVPDDDDLESGELYGDELEEAIEDNPAKNSVVTEQEPTEFEIELPTKTATTAAAVQKSPKPKSKKNEVRGVYSRSLITKKVTLPITNVGKNLRETLETSLRQSIEGKCILEGFVRTGSIKIVTHSSGVVQSSNVVFEVVFECDVCYPVEGMLLNCIAKNITKAGIRADSATETPSPFVVFVARDHHYMLPYFSSIEENTKFVARVIGQRFELNDKYVSIIAELVEPKGRDAKRKDGTSKPRLVF
uniref:S1 motif domain-containing protein n=1 Tax=viral metagenome TaxID=1070528 RepID=A0A6C0F6E4_9ZZZZ